MEGMMVEEVVNRLRAAWACLRGRGVMFGVVLDFDDDGACDISAQDGRTMFLCGYVNLGWELI
jgi:hypothetical protein